VCVCVCVCVYVCLCMYLCMYIFREILNMNKDFLLKSINQLTFVIETQCLREVRNKTFKVRRYV